MRDAPTQLVSETGAHHLGGIWRTSAQSPFCQWVGFGVGSIAMVMGGNGWSYEQTHLEIVLETVAVFALEGLGPVCVCVLALCPVAIRRQRCAAGESKLVVVNLQLEWVHVPIYSSLNVPIPWGGNPAALSTRTPVVRMRVNTKDLKAL